MSVSCKGGLFCTSAKADFISEGTSPVALILTETNVGEEPFQAIVVDLPVEAAARDRAREPLSDSRSLEVRVILLSPFG
ncbi:hypothetical protein [Stenomitos frigidus]|uniref:Uncharacterized protein n=1 Tax=Stenomitos frigidus ULC18 TaxID=2107698 RepID=A0A2T1E160_9CYAN|nr:hypothetical protein [Stenomitos frigidus]PSB26495.1 hypothetical protein C7B82_19700 [Stenomitos frigidus ULC18]